MHLKFGLMVCVACKRTSFLCEQERLICASMQSIQNFPCSHESSVLLENSKTHQFVSAISLVLVISTRTRLSFHIQSNGFTVLPCANIVGGIKTSANADQTQHCFFNAFCPNLMIVSVDSVNLMYVFYNYPLIIIRLFPH